MPDTGVPQQQSPLPLERLEAELCTLAAQVAAASCRFLVLVEEFDRREGWAGGGVRSCAHWLAWKCGLAPGAAREHVRVARALVTLPRIRAEFAVGRLSYAKVRALTRVATPDSDAELVELALCSTAAQLEKIVRGLRKASEVADEQERSRRRSVHWWWDDDGSLVLHARLSPEEGAVVVAALEAAQDAVRAASDAPTTPAGTPQVTAADALVVLGETVLAVGPTAASGSDRYQVVVHVDRSTLATAGPGRSALVDGPALRPETIRRMACDAALVTMLDGDTGSTLDVGRRTRAIPPAIRRALRARDGGCRFPGCPQRRFVDGHHIVHWSRGGRTSLDNLILLCRHHHHLVHEGGYGLTVLGPGRFRFTRPNGEVIPESPIPPRVKEPALARYAPTAGPTTIVPTWGGEPLDLEYVVWTVLTRAAARSRSRAGAG
jgi:hypothetical protein